MIRDEIWHRKLVDAIGRRRDGFTAKQWARYRMDGLLKVAARVRDLSPSCETCQGFQHTLSRLEEELQELPDSKAQRQYQAQQLALMEAHFVVGHRLASPGFFVRKWVRLGVLAGVVVGCLAALVTGSFLLIPAATLVGLGVGLLYGQTEDQKVEREHRRI